MAHQGEDLKFTIQGTDEIRLDEMDFYISVYPSFQNGGNSITIEKDAFEEIKDEDGNSMNTFVGKIPYTTTSGMLEGVYNMELLTKEGEEPYQERSIYVKKHAFVIESSVSKNL
jgi:hypothetical protein